MTVGVQRGTIVPPGFASRFLSVVVWLIALWLRFRKDGGFCLNTLCQKLLRPLFFIKTDHNRSLTLAKCCEGLNMTVTKFNEAFVTTKGYFADIYQKRFC